MTKEISESRFYMWRAVFAMAHADHKVRPEEVEYAQRYLDALNFSDEQRTLLAEDLFIPQEVGAMFIGIKDVQDQSDFFQFAHMMVWADEDLHEQEKKILERLTAEQMNKFNLPKLREQIRQARKAAKVRRDIEDEEFRRQAKDVVGIGNILKCAWPWAEHNTSFDPGPDTFTLWRAVFSLAHADNRITREESDYIQGMMDVFHFPDYLQSIVHEDLKNAPDVEELFDEIKSAEHIRAFFKAAQTILWIDGEFSARERSAMDALREKAAAHLEGHEDVVSWMDVDGRSDVIEDKDGNLFKSFAVQMKEFYEREFHD